MQRNICLDFVCSIYWKWHIRKPYLVAYVSTVTSSVFYAKIFRLLLGQCVWSQRPCVCLNPIFSFTWLTILCLLPPPPSWPAHTVNHFFLNGSPKVTVQNIALYRDNSGNSRILNRIFLENILLECVYIVGFKNQPARPVSPPTQHVHCPTPLPLPLPPPSLPSPYLTRDNNLIQVGPSQASGTNSPFLPFYEWLKG